jgi:hypothetical protein
MATTGGGLVPIIDLKSFATKVCLLLLLLRAYVIAGD